MPIVYTARVAFTNYSTGHISSKSEAIKSIQANTLQPAMTTGPPPMRSVRRPLIGSISAALLLSLASQVCFIFTIYFAAQIFQDPAEPTPFPTLQQHFLLIPGGVAVQALFPLPNGIGSEGFFGWLYARVDETMWNAGLLAAMSQRIIIWVLAVIGYYTYLRMRPALPPSAQEEPALAAVPTAS